MDILKQWKFDQNTIIAQVDKYPENVINEHVAEYMMQNVPSLPWRSQLDDSAVKKLKQLHAGTKENYRLKLVALEGKQIVGWSFGFQDTLDSSSYFMAGSVVLPERRRQGLYSALVAKVLEITEKKGFQSVWSMHIMNNNPVLIAKLKQGFVINGFEVNTIYGALVKLTFNHSELRKKALNFRAGSVKETEIISLLKKRDHKTL